ncbi:YigZ family protein [Aquisalimonas sp.]|uniref:IMPACT family protein n=1 Tax=Aquisalimonas sp. TaxID=1872621 RepID=UPI0025B7DD11|nr:YigZ family protein [Aquisalimonas sp.]
MSSGYTVPAQSLEREIAVRRSRFIARASRVETRAAALADVEQARAEHPDARHHCWAYLIGDPVSASTAASDDDGEPGGTAGRPILNVIQHKGLGDVLVVVIRYFGGIKLGAGGLTRAYAQATEAVLSELPVTLHEPVCGVTVAMHFAQEQAMRHWVQGHRGEVDAIRYGEGVSMDITIPVAEVDAFRAFCAAQSITIHETV